MKMLFAECCATIVVPSPVANRPRYCDCGASCCWWIEPYTGKFGCHSRTGKHSVSVIGLHNGLLQEPIPLQLGAMPKDTIRRLLDETPDHYLFKRVDSLVIRLRPGTTSDTFFYAELPDAVRASIENPSGTKPAEGP